LRLCNTRTLTGDQKQATQLNGAICKLGLRSWRCRYLADAGRYADNDWPRRSLIASRRLANLQRGGDWQQRLTRASLRAVGSLTHRCVHHDMLRSLTTSVRPQNDDAVGSACRGRRWTLPWFGIHPSRIRTSSMISRILPQCNFCCLGAGSRGM
jgi:hypothetical protein